MLSSYFDRMLERETEQGKRENLLFQTIYDMVYQNMEKYGAEFAGIQAGNSATERMTDQNGTECMILETDGTITLAGSLKLPQDEIRRLAEEMLRTMDPGADQVYGVRKVGTCYIFSRISRIFLLCRMVGKMAAVHKWYINGRYPEISILAVKYLVVG